jgi:hypothetical protein
MLSIDSILGLVTSIEKLTDIAIGDNSSSPDKQNGLQQRLPVEREHCIALIEVSWRTILDALSQLLSKTSGEALIVQLLKVCLSSPLSDKGHMQHHACLTVPCSLDGSC